MAAQKGKELVLQLENPAGSGTFVGIAGLVATRSGFNAETVDITNADSVGGWRELLAGAGTRSVAASGSGLFIDSAADEAARMVYFSQEIRTWRVILPSFGVIEGPFQITALEYSGSHDGAVRFEMSLASAGALTFNVL